MYLHIFRSCYFDYAHLFKKYWHFSNFLFIRRERERSIGDAGNYALDRWKMINSRAYVCTWSQVVLCFPSFVIRDDPNGWKKGVGIERSVSDILRHAATNSVSQRRWKLNLEINFHLRKYGYFKFESQR